MTTELLAAQQSKSLFPTNIANSPAHVLQPNLKPWERFDFPACTQAVLFMDWGEYYSRRLLTKTAIKYFGHALEACQKEAQLSCCTKTPKPKTSKPVKQCQLLQNSNCISTFHTLHKRSKCKRSIAQPEEAFQDADDAHYIMQVTNLVKQNVTLNKCDALFECNQFEDNLVLLHVEARKYQGQAIIKEFQRRQDCTLDVIRDTLGEGFNPFVLEHWPLIKEVTRKPPAPVSPRPLWQQLRERQHCDVESVQEKKKLSLSSLERARRRVNESLYNYHYLGIGANYDVDMIRLLRDYTNFLNPYMTELSTELYRIVRKFMKMMHCCKPLYQIKQDKCGHTKICEKNRENYLYRIEYQTRRDCYRMLREVREKRKTRSIDQLTNYIEHVMSNNIVLKTHRTLPWKWQFINEVYNILALAHIDKCAVSRNVNYLDTKNFGLLFLLPAERHRDITLQFGDGQNIYGNIKKDEERLNHVTLKSERLERRLLHSRYGIERAYLLFEIARCHFKAGRFDKCVIMAKKAANEARQCNSIIWRFISSFLLCQVHATFYRYERLAETLYVSMKLAKRLKCEELEAYLELCKTINDYAWDNQRKRQSDISMRVKNRRRKGRISVSSYESQD